MIVSNPNNVNLTLENVRSRLNGIEFFSRYIPNFPGVERNFSSPFREDKNPSCKVFQRDGEFIMYDYTSKETYGAVKFTMAYYGCTFGAALSHIDTEFNLGLANGKSVSNLTRQQASTSSKTSILKRIQIKRRSWGEAHTHYWQQHGYNIEIVKKLGIVPISHYWISRGFKRSAVALRKQIAFAYTEWAPHYKLYMPNMGKTKRFVSSTRAHHIQGGKALPEKGEVLILTSSMKDCVFFWNAGIPAVAPQSESPTLNKNFINYIKNRFTEIIIIYDNDYQGEKNWGQINALKLAERNPSFKNVRLPDIAKDPSEFALQMGYHNAFQLICESIINQTGIDICQQGTLEKGIITSSMSSTDLMPF